MSQCFDLDISVSESTIASAHFDGAVRLWSTRSGELFHEMKSCHDDIISCVRFTPDERYIVTTGK
jgi:WD40 repeat protein